VEPGPLHRRTSRIALLLITAVALAVPAPCTGASDDGSPIRLDDGWWFRAGDDPDRAAPDPDQGGWDRVEIPHSWPDAGLPGHDQIGWYRRVVELPELAPDGRPLALRMGTVRNAYGLYLDGRPVGGVGSLPPDPRVNHDRVLIQPIPPELLADGRLVIAVRVWGGTALEIATAGAGFRSGPVLLGVHGELVRRLAAEDTPKQILATLFAAIGLYFLYLFARNRGLRPHLWFGLTALPLAVHVLTQTQWKYQSGLSFLLLEKIESISLFLVFVFLAELIRAVLERPPDWWMRLFQALFLGFALALLVIPGLDVHYLIRPAWQAVSVAVILPMTWVIGSAAVHGSRSGRILGLALLAFIVFAVNDLLVNMGLLNGVLLIPAGFLGVLVAMGVILADRFSGLLESLEIQVAARTRELEAANDALAAANERLRLRSRMDPLTDLLNRRGFVAEVEAERKRVERGARTFGLLLLDVDFFKRFNDDHGHACGDQVLCEVARVLESQTREVDRVGRWGGEEFVILLPETDTDGLARVAEKLRAAIAALAVRCEGQQLGVTATFGAALPGDGETFEACLERADQALYAGKDNGRNRVEMAV
jgi:diguanylate cyclase (GGDEF)-like protein